MLYIFFVSQGKSSNKNLLVCACTQIVDSLVTTRDIATRSPNVFNVLLKNFHLNCSVIIMVVVRKISGNVLSLSVKKLSSCKISSTLTLTIASCPPITKFASITSSKLEISSSTLFSNPDVTVIKM